VTARETERRIPERPYRDSALLFTVLAGMIFLVTLLTGGSVLKAILVAAGVFVLATAWTWWRFRTRIERNERGRERGR
jgi:membrane protein implicated in regulation of membrane protease activity